MCRAWLANESLMLKACERQAKTHPQPANRSQVGACMLQLPPKGLAVALLAFMMPVPVSRGTRCSMQVGSWSHSCRLLCTACRGQRLQQGTMHIRTVNHCHTARFKKRCQVSPA